MNDQQLLEPSPRIPWRTNIIVVSAWAVALLLVWRLGLHVVANREADLKLEAIPLYGEWEWGITWWLVAPVIVGILVVVFLPPLSQRWPWQAVLIATAASGVLFSLALAEAQTHPTVLEDIYRTYARHITYIDEAGGVGPFLNEYTEYQSRPSFPVHLRSHPPGLLLFFWAASWLGFYGPEFTIQVAMVCAAASIVAALAILREVAGERLARRAAPFLVIAPAAVWHTNADIIFAGVVLSAVACLVIATGRTGYRAAGWTVAGGLLAGMALMLAFGIVLLAIPVVVIALMRKQWLVLAGGAAIALLVVLVPLIWGYWWMEGLEVTRERYYGGVADARGYWYFLVANLAVFALAVGPAIAVALARLRDRMVWIVVGSGLAVVAVANLSGMSSGETERIWQPFMPLVMLAGCVFERAREIRGWLSLHLGLTVVLVAALYVAW